MRGRHRANVADAEDAPSVPPRSVYRTVETESPTPTTAPSPSHAETERPQEAPTSFLERVHPGLGAVPSIIPPAPAWAPRRFPGRANALRERLTELVRERPGLHLRAIARRMGLDPNLAKYHLLRLENAGRVASRRDGKFWVFYPAAAVRSAPWDPTELDVAAVLQRRAPRRIARLLLHLEAASIGVLARAAGLPRTTLRHHLRTLETRGVVAAERRGRWRIYRLAQPGRVWLHLERLNPGGTRT